MKDFFQFQFEPKTCRQELLELKQLLDSRQYLSERDDILPFFRARQHLSAFIGSWHPRINRYNRIAFEYDIFGDFACDLVIGDSLNKSYCFVEFEDAASNSVFVSRVGRNTPEWSPRFERGFSQIVDWFWKLDDLAMTKNFENRFNSRSIDYIGLLIIGRNEGLERREKERLEWRQKKTIVNSQQITCITFDDLYQSLLNPTFRTTKCSMFEGWVEQA